MAPKKPGPGDKRDKGKEKDPAPWRVEGIQGVIPPGRRLSPDKRPRVWSASGVKGVAPPGNLAPGKGPATEWILKHTKGSGTGGGKRGKGKDHAKPTAGFVPEVRTDREPASIKELLDQIGEFFRKNAPEAGAIDELDLLIRQSHQPYEIIVAFTIMTALIGDDSGLRNRYQRALERGAKAFYNLAGRLDKKVKPPRGLAPQTLDPIFFDLPHMAFQVPYAFIAQAFAMLLELVRGSIAHDRALVKYSRALHEQFIGRRSYGDQPLSALFPWDDPRWAPRED